MRSLLILLPLSALLFWAGCAGKQVKPLPPPVEVQRPEREILLEHLIGKWEAPPREGKERIATFDAAGSLTFSGALLGYNPARWDLDAANHELTITFPSISNERLQIFQLYVGQGIKSFHPQAKQIVYAFMKDTWTLNIGGWEYTKYDTAPKQQAEPEPTFK